MLARIGYWIHNAAGCTRKGGGDLRVDDFLPVPEETEEQKAMWARIEARKLEAAERNKKLMQAKKKGK